MKLAFFDFDGTICAPNYLVDGDYKIGMPAERWDAFIKEKKDDIFADCKPVSAVLSYARTCKENGDRVIVLTRTGGEIEDSAKQVFLKKHAPQLFDTYISVRKDEEKIERIREMAQKEAIALSDCELIEDTYSILLDAVSEGITGIHISNLYENMK